MQVDAVRLKVERAPKVLEPFPHLVADDLLVDDDLLALVSAFPPVAAFDAKGKGVKLELDIAESARAFAALPVTSREQWTALRTVMRTTVGPVLANRFEGELRRHYEWLLGDALASEVMARGFTTTNGRVMGRGFGYRLEPHLDSAHFGVTCLLYFATAATASDGALCLYTPERLPAVVHASTYYPARDENIPVSIAKEVPVRQNRFVAFANSPLSLHGFSRPAPQAEAAEWRFVYQCHVVPEGFDIRALAGRLSGERLERWSEILSRLPDLGAPHG